MSPQPKPHRATTDQHVLVNPHDLVLPEDPSGLAPEDEFVGSVGRHGVLMPPLVVRRDDGAYVVVAGRRRVMAARWTEKAILVRIVDGDDVEIARLAIIEDHHIGRRRSTIERSWMVGAYIRAVRASGAEVTVRSLAADLEVGSSRAHYWMRIAEGLPHERLERLAARVGADPVRLRGLPVTQAVQLAATHDDDAAEQVLRGLLDQTGPQESPEGGPWARLWRILRLVLSWLRSLLRRQA